MSTGDAASVRAVILAHQGGWDEVLLVLVPIALFTGLLWLANARAARDIAQRKAALEDAEEPDE